MSTAAAQACNQDSLHISSSGGSSSSSCVIQHRPARYQVHLIQHSERYNELLAQVFVPQQQPKQHEGASPGAAQPAIPKRLSNRLRYHGMGPIWTLHEKAATLTAAAAAGSNGSSVSSSSSSSSSGSSNSSLVPLHPAASVTLEQLATPAAVGGGWPSELPLSPEEALQLYDALCVAVQQLKANHHHHHQQQQQQEQEDDSRCSSGCQSGRPDVQGLLQQLEELAPERVLMLPPAAVAACVDDNHPLGSAGAAAAGSTRGKNSQTSKHVSKAPSLKGSHLSAAAAADPSAPGSAHPHEVFLSKQAAKAWTRQLVLLLEQWARPAGSTAAGTSAGSTGADNTAAAPSHAHTPAADTCAQGPAGTGAAPATALPAPAAAVGLALQLLSAGPAAAMAADQAAWEEQHPTEPCYDWAYQRQHLLELVLSLRAAGELPAILFNFERGLCMAYAALLCDALSAAEDTWRQQHAAELEAERRRLAAVDAAGGPADSYDDGGRGGRQQRGRGASGGDAGVQAESVGGSGPDLRTVTVGGVVASGDDTLPDPSFTLLPYDKARSQVGCVSGQLCTTALSGTAQLYAVNGFTTYPQDAMHRTAYFFITWHVHFNSTGSGKTSESRCL